MTVMVYRYFRWSDELTRRMVALWNCGDLTKREIGLELGLPWRKAKDLVANRLVVLKRKGWKIEPHHPRRALNRRRAA